MDPKKHPLVIVEELLRELRPAPGGMYSLFAYHHTLECRKSQLAPKDANTIAKISSQDVNDGLTSNMWNRIEARIRIYLRQGVLEWQPQKP